MRRSPIPVVALLVGAALAAPAAAADRFDPLEMLEKSDANHDGVITRAELIDARRERFGRMDRNGDDYFSDNDLPRMVRNRAGEKVDRVVQLLDADRDGRLSRAEFVDGPTRVFDAADTDHNGQIDRQEIQRLKTMAAARKGG